MDVKLDDVGSRDNGILFQQYSFCFGGEGTVRFAEDDYWISYVSDQDPAPPWRLLWV